MASDDLALSLIARCVGASSNALELGFGMGALVSILIPCYNAERWIAQAIESALAQTWVEKEVIVLDDGSTDSSLEIIRQFEGRIRWETGPNTGGGAARNRLLGLARGEWLQYLDADDYLRPEKIASQIEFLREHPYSDVVCSPTAWQGVVNGSIVCIDTEIPKVDPWILLASWQLPQTGGTLWKKEAVERIGGWRVDQSCCQEHELYCRLLEARMRFEFCDGALAVYRDLELDGRVTRRSRGGEWERRRLAILDRIERCLEQRSELTVKRRQAINDARHELARGLWHNNRQFAVTTHTRIRKSDPSFFAQPSTIQFPILFGRLPRVRISSGANRCFLETRFDFINRSNSRIVRIAGELLALRMLYLLLLLSGLGVVKTIYEGRSFCKGPQWFTLFFASPGNGPTQH